MKLADLIPKVEGITVAVVKEEYEGTIGWFMYLINEKDIPITNVLIQSNGVGELDAWPMKTSTLRHFIQEMPPLSFRRIEMLIEEVFILENSYWVSFYIDTNIFDKKFVFPANTIVEEKCIAIPILNMDGIIAH
jgi:hypothetical protein